MLALQLGGTVLDQAGPIDNRYDVSGVPADRIQRIIERDWSYLVLRQGILDSPNYLREKGKPVVGLWGEDVVLQRIFFLFLFLFFF